MAKFTFSSTTLFGGSASSLVGNSSNDTLSFETATSALIISDTLFSGLTTQIEALVLPSFSTNRATLGEEAEAAGFSSIYGGAQADFISAAGYTSGINIYDLAGLNTLIGGEGNDRIIGSANDANSLLGNGGNDTMEGGSGKDTLNGGAGADRMSGKGGNDFYIVDDSGDVVVESLDGGVDIVLAKVSEYTLAGNTEWLTLDSTIESGTGNSLANTLVGNSAANTLNGGIGNDSMVGLAGNDYYILDSLSDVVVEATSAGTDSVEARITGYTLAGNVEALILANSVASGFGNSLANQILGNSIANTLNGGIGVDTMDGGAGNDFYIVDSLLDKVVETLSLSGTPSLNGGIDSVLAQVSGYTLAGDTEYLILDNGVGSGFGNSLSNTLLGNSIANTLDGGAGNDTLDGGGGNDTLNGGEGADSLIGGAGADFYIIDNLGDKVFESLSGDIDTVISSVDFTLSANVERLTLTGSDTLKGIGNSLANTLVGNSVANTLDGGAGNDSLVGGAGNDFYIIDSLTDIVVEGASAGTDSVLSSITNYVLASNVEVLVLAGAIASGSGNSLNNTLIGNAATNTLQGDAGNDSLDGGAGNDWLNGGVGNDTLSGGDGNDHYTVDSLADVVVESSSLGGNDSVLANINGYTLSGNTEWLILGSTATTGNGNELANTLLGNFLANTLNGGTGIDSMAGDFGNDFYFVDSLADKVIETLGGGIDSVLANVSGYTLAGNTEWLILGSSATTGTGNSLGNTLIGNSLDNTLNAGAGLDSMAGGNGDDVYIVTDAENSIFETSDGGVDTVISSASITLGLNLEKLILSGTAVAGFGNSVANTIIGNSIANTLDGGGGGDSLVGEAGNDYYILNSLTDQVVEASLSGGMDSVLSKITGYTLDDYVETLILGNSVAAGTGNSAANTLIGNSAANTLDGGAGVDSLIGLGGNDYYIIDSLSDKVFEEANAGIDSVLSQISGYTLAGNIEWLLLASTIESGTGNSLANTLVGNSVENTLNGGLGNDSLFGGAGDDYYIIDSLSDVVAETLGINSTNASLNGGIDSVLASVSGYTLSGNVEWLTLASTIGAGTGNALANTLAGNSASNTLDGGAGNDSIDADAGNDWLNGGLGNDTLVGGLGNDYYIIDSLTDVVVESSTLGGNDSVLSSVNHTLGDNFEVLILGGAAASGAGNSLANTLIGNSLANTLDGGSGNDSLAGGAGNDFYIVDSLTDAIFEAAGAGTDSVLAKINNYTLAGNTEWLKLDDNIGAGIGNSLANTLLGNSLANTLNGGAGNDSLAGGDGDDLYFVDSLLDIVFESLGGGLDSVVANVSGYTLSGNVEWLRLDSTFAAGTGNSLANTLIGNASANTLDGGTGNDSLVGLAGNDFYIIDSLSDEVIESTLSGGVDSVQAKVSGYTLEDNTEVLILAGTVGLGTGNSLANTLIGNSVGNTLDGGLGNDSLVGLAGNDYYKINSLTDIVVEATDGGIDSVLANVNGYTLAGNAEWLILDSNIASGVGNSLANTLLGNADDNTLNGGLGSDSLIGGAGDDYYIIDRASDVVLESVSSGTDSILANLSVYTLAGNAEVLILGTGTTGIGNILNNTLIGNSLSNLLTGNTGDDSLFGFSGDDNLTGCTNLATGGKGEKDTLTGGIGSDIFNLGSALGVFYNYGVAGNTGEDDFAYITDFTVGKDILKLKGTALQYSLGDHTVAGLNSYKGLYFETGATDELIAIIQPASGTLDITSLMANAQFV
jgi:Ca2+-binding RTX toxin-like protein